MASIVRCEGKDDGVYIRRYVEVSRKGIGCTSPNPMVGCVFVKDGKIVAEVMHSFFLFHCCYGYDGIDDGFGKYF